MVVFGYLSALLIGISLGLLGGGGAILSVPIFVYLFSVKPELATTYSMFVVGVASLIGFFSYFKKGLYNLKMGMLLAIPSFFAVNIVKRLIMPAIPQHIYSFGSFELTKDLFIMISFSVIMLLASISMIRPKSNSTEHKKNETELQKMISVATKGFIVGVVTGFVGAGGGFLLIPALVVLLNLPMKEAVGTSLAIIAANSLVGFTNDLFNPIAKLIDWQLLVVFTIITVIGIFSGSFLSKHVSEKKLKPAFGWFVLIMGLVILMQQILARSSH